MQNGLRPMLMKLNLDWGWRKRRDGIETVAERGDSRGFRGILSGLRAAGCGLRFAGCGLRVYGFRRRVFDVASGGKCLINVYGCP